MIWIYILLSLVFNAVIAILIALRYRYILSKIDKKISFFSSLIIISLTFLLRSIIPFRGGAVTGTPIAGRIKEKISIENGLTIVTFENIFDTIWQLLTLILIFFFSKNKFFGENVLFFD